jgi:gliding motility-associated-like protein
MNLYAKACCVLFALSAISFTSTAQLVLSANKTAAILSAALAGTGVTILSPTLTCAGNANAVFTTGAISPLGIPSGIVLTTGNAVDSTVAGVFGYGVGDPSSDFANTANGTPGDPELDVLVAPNPTNDACILEFNFKPAGDTIKFDYVFGSEEYTSYTCSPFNDVFAFFISGGSYATPTNLALVPGTSIPVAVNSVNCGATGGYPLSTCTAMGPGSPFCAYYVNNLLPASPAYNYCTYDGLTTVLQVVAPVSPCDTYHLKLAIADAGDDAFDSGVFIEGGSLTSATTTAVTATGTSGLPYCIRGCAPGDFVFTTPVPQDTNIVVHYIITGSAVNGYDYATIPDSATIIAGSTSTTVFINTLPVPPVGPVVVTLEIQVPNPCSAGYSIGAVANLTILDSFTFHIITPDTSICDGAIVNIVAVGDTIFDSILHYAWTPPGTLSNDTTLLTTATPTVTTTYTLTGTTAAVLGCAPEHHVITITVYNPSFDSVTFTNPTVCGYCDGTLTLWGLQTGFADTLFYTYNGTAHIPVPVVVSGAGTVTINGLCAGVYSNIYVKVGECYTLVKGPKTLVNPPPPVVTVDSPLVKTCVGVPVQLHAYVTPGGIPYFYTWTPPGGLSSTTISNPIVTPTVPGDVIYTVTVNPDANPACAAFATVDVHTVPNNFNLVNKDTVICLGAQVQVVITGGSPEFTWLWAPPAGVSNVNIENPIITPTISATYTVTASYAHCPNMVDSFHIEVDYPAPAVTFTDTICLGGYDSVNVTVSGGGYYHYQWTPASYVSNDTIPNPIITPTVTGNLSWTITIQPHAAACAIIDVLNLLVIPNSFTVTPTNTSICRGASVQILGTPYPLFSYQWSPTEGIATPFIINPLINPDTSTTYIVTATYAKCPDMHDTVFIDVQPNPTAYIGGNRFVCANDTLHLNASVVPMWYEHYAYTWSPGLHLDNDTAITVVFSNDTNATVVTSSTIVFTVTTTAGCFAIDSATITVYPVNFAAITPSQKDFCPHDTAVLSPSGGVGYRWSPSLYLSDSLSGLPVIKPITSQTYTIIGTSQYGCQDTINFTAIVHPAAVLFIPDSVTIYPGETYQIAPQTNCASFAWSPPGGLNDAYISNPIASPVISTKYVVNATTEWGCKTKDSIEIYVDDGSLLTLPNAFAPGNGPNSEFKIIKRGLASLNYFRIFNRWGNLVFETTDIDKGWNGEYNGSPQPMGVFVYQVQAVTSDGKIFEKHGNVTLIR